MEDVEVTYSSNHRVSGVLTAPPCSSFSSNPPGRGFERKTVCINAATRMGRKKTIEQDYDLGALSGEEIWIQSRLAAYSLFLCDDLVVSVLPNGATSMDSVLLKTTTENTNTGLKSKEKKYENDFTTTDCKIGFSL
ncbi:hypothetical protein Nepgr_018240 [Nepenthes gracilis]|uniref:Uncharacterized protein n=1 Tax=Nepenthes gracilis TaxID=150966 RepID=A0AAD3ST74_NEPGR|nr:hypothetical protein Nepgr_018240 [Nepenthes gracilis]